MTKKRVWFAMPVTRRQAARGKQVYWRACGRGKYWCIGGLLSLPFVSYPVLYGPSSSLVADTMCVIALAILFGWPKLYAEAMAITDCRMWEGARYSVGETGVRIRAKEFSFRGKWSAYKCIVETSEHVICVPCDGSEFIIYKRSLSEADLSAVMSVLASVPLPRR
jgi:hypothetical protein